jgi:ribose 5-phosphate isomerase A
MNSWTEKNEDFKRQAAIVALDEIRDDMVVGLGTGSTATHFIRELGARVSAGLKILGIPTSDASKELAGELGIPLTNFIAHPAVDVTVDGADEVSPELELIKGLGGALVREKIVARASRRVVIVVDEAKLVDKLGSRAVIPIEVVPFAVELVTRRLAEWDGPTCIRQKEGKAFLSDNGNLVIDWQHGPIDQPSLLEKRLKELTGVVDCGLFCGIANLVIVAGPNGCRKLERR